MEERLRFVARLSDGEAMTDVCRDFGVSLHRQVGRLLALEYPGGSDAGLTILVRIAGTVTHQITSLDELAL